MNQVRAVAIAVLLACAGCATPPPPAPPPVASADPRVLAFQRSLDEALAREPAAVRRRYLARVVAVEERGADLLFDIEVERGASFGREPENLDLMAACAATALEDCLRKTMAAIRGAAALN